MSQSTYRIDGLPGIDRPRERIAALNARISEKDGKQYFALCSTLALPVETIWVDAQGRVWMEEFEEESWRLLGHLQWLARQPLPTRIPAQSDPLARYKVLKARMYGTMAVPEFDLTGTGELVSAANVWIDADGRVSREHFRGARPLLDHVAWLEQKRSVAEFVRKMREELDARARRELRELADQTPHEPRLRRNRAA